MTRQYEPRIKAGRCRNGAERDSGNIWHAVPVDSWRAMCGAMPGRTSAGWSGWQPAGQPVTCPKCLRQIALAAADLNDGQLGGLSQESYARQAAEKNDRQLECMIRDAGAKLAKHGRRSWCGAKKELAAALAEKLARRGLWETEMELLCENGLACLLFCLMMAGLLIFQWMLRPRSRELTMSDTMSDAPVPVTELVIEKLTCAFRVFASAEPDFSQECGDVAVFRASADGGETWTYLCPMHAAEAEMTHPWPP